MKNIKDNYRTVKFVGYLYLPKDDSDYKGLRDFSSKQMGRIIINDENGKPIDARGYAFANMGQMLNRLLQEYKKRVMKILPPASKR